jgi:hypothetical protein
MDILDNPFFVLGATTRDDRRRIMGLAEEKSLLSEEEVAAEASSALTNPRKRLAAEVGWLPGIGPRRAAEAVAMIQGDAERIRDSANLPALARANLLAAGLVRAVDSISAEEVAEWIVDLAETHDEVDPESTMTLINEERSVAGFPAVTDGHAFEAELGARRQHYRTAIKNALNHLSSADLVKVVTEAVDAATDVGESHAPILIDDLVDSFEVEAQGFLEKETKNIATLIEQIRAAAAQEQDEAVLKRLVSNLERVVKNWDLVAQPIQVSARSRGLDHALSHELAGEVRGLAVELFNEHDHLEISQRLTTLIQEVFAEVDRVVEQTEEDAAALDEIAEQRTEFLNNVKAHVEQWRQEITYEAEWGLVFKDKLKISPEGVEWKGRRIALDSISRLRWGATKHYVNGIPSGTTYSIFVGTERDGASIELNKEKIYGEFIERLWKAVGTRLLTQMLEGLKQGQRYRFGNAVIDDYGVELERHHTFRANERVRCRWTDLVIGNANGGFYLAKKDESKVEVQLPYQEEDNVHVLEAAMRIFWKRAGARISDLLKQEG